MLVGREDYKKALEARVSRLAAECMAAITDDQEQKLRREMMAGVNELSDEFNSVKIVYTDKRVHDVVKMGFTEKWNKGIRSIQKEVAKIEKGGQDENLQSFKQIYKIMELMHDLVDGRI